MHIPDGYLSPATCAVMYAAAVPFWVTAVRKVRNVLNDRTVPLLAIFAAFAFAIMMFNVPVPGGTTAHGVGGTLIAIVLGPWAAIIGVSTALILQALFFGDGGITAIGANCFNMAIVLPLVGYAVYLLVARNSNILSHRRIVAAAIGSYVGITAAALCAGIELGIQPIFWISGGHAIYSPYGLKAAVPAMLLAHAFGASFVEAAITALGIAYLQRSRPDLLLLRRGRVEAPEPGLQPAGARVSLWAVGGILAAICLPLALIAGFIMGGGRLNHLFGADWTQVDWADVGKVLLIVLVANLILLPAAYFASPRRWRTLVTVMVGIALWTPIGLITPGIAYAEFVPSSGDTAVPGAGYVPSGLASLSGRYHALLPGYNFPWISGDDPVSKQALGYMVSGFVGMALLMLLGVLVYALVRRHLPHQQEEDWRTAT
jgi:cobalt/nickel transport system permease protein